jgi:hypothetical protein
MGYQLLNDANLLVTYDVENRLAARNEIRQVLKHIGEEQPEFLSSRVQGLFLIYVTQDPKAVTTHLDALCQSDPSLFWYTYHWIPVETWCPSTIEAMAAVVEAWATRAHKISFNRIIDQWRKGDLCAFVVSPTFILIWSIFVKKAPNLPMVTLVL